MYKNYFYLCRCVKQLEQKVHGYKIIDAYTQEKDKLFLHIPLEGKPNFHLIINTNQHHPSLSTKDDHYKAKKNTVNFFKDFLPSTIESICIALGDRVIRIILNNGTLTILFKGGRTNIFLSDQKNELQPFKKVSGEEIKNFRDETNALRFINSLEPIYSLVRNTDDEKMIRKMPFIGKEILMEVEARDGDFTQNLLKVLNEIEREKIIVHYDDYLGKATFHPVSFKTYKIPDRHFIFDNYFEALNKYFTLSFSQIKVINIRKEIEKFLNKEIETLSGKLNKLKGRIDSGSKEEIYHKYGEMLLANIKLIRKGMKEIELENYYTGITYKIKLDEKLSPNQNIDRYFEKSRSEKIEYQKSKELLNLNVKEYGRITGLRDKFNKTDDQETLMQIKKELKMKTEQSMHEDAKEKSLYRHFLIAGKYHIYVGKDSKNNDRLTTKFAKQNDFWFHARSVSGSHVVLRVDNTKESIPKNILQNVASVAAFYSKAKTSKLIPVTYTLKKYVVKNSRHEPGQVTVTKESVLLVKPEIPKECKMVVE